MSGHIYIYIYTKIYIYIFNESCIKGRNLSGLSSANVYIYISLHSSLIYFDCVCDRNVIDQESVKSLLLFMKVYSGLVFDLSQFIASAGYRTFFCFYKYLQNKINLGVVVTYKAEGCYISIYIYIYNLLVLLV